MRGRIVSISGSTVGMDIKGVNLYDMIYVGSERLTAEIIRIGRERVIAQVYEDTKGLSIGEPVEAAGSSLQVTLGPGLLGGILDGLQRPLEGLKSLAGPFIKRGKELPPIDYSRKWLFTPLKERGDRVFKGEVVGYFREGHFKHYVLSDHEGEISLIKKGETSLEEPLIEFKDKRVMMGYTHWPVRVKRPYKRKLAPIEPLITGQRVIDFLFPLAKGGTSILPGGFGTGKTVLEQSIAKYADVDIVIYVGCGERGNEMAEMIEEFSTLKDPWTGRLLTERTILIANTSNMPVAAREASIYTAVTLAEYYRDMGYHVLLLADSLSRWAEALREISTSLEEMPGEESYPTYLASRLATFFERAGYVETLSGQKGSLSMILTVSPPGGDLTEPVTQACLRPSGGFLMLDTSLAHSRHFPAVHWFQSYSLYGATVDDYFIQNVSSQWKVLKARCMEILRREESLKEVAEIVGFEGLMDKDRLILKVAEMIRTEFFCQNAYTKDAFSPPEGTANLIKDIIDTYDNALERLDKGAELDEVMKLFEK